MAGDVRSASNEPRKPEDEAVMQFEPEPTEAKEKPVRNEEKKPDAKLEYDEFGLPIRKLRIATPEVYDEDPPSPTENNSLNSMEKTTVETSQTPEAPAPPVSPLPATEPASHERNVSVISNRSLNAEEPKLNEKKMVSDDPSDPSMPKGGGVVSEWSHQHSVPRKQDQLKEEKSTEAEDEWQAMPAYASHDMWDDDGRLIAKAAVDSEDEGDGAMGGASKGYTRVNDEEDAASVTSMDENTKYLFQENEDDEASRNPLSQMQATKDLLTEGQRIAYVGICRLAVAGMTSDTEKLDAKGRIAKKELQLAKESIRMWSQKMMVRLYTHMEITPAEQIMIEQLAEHGVIASDMTPTLMKNSRVANPINQSTNPLSSPPRPSSICSEKSLKPPKNENEKGLYDTGYDTDHSSTAMPPPPYEETAHDELPDVRTPSQLPESKTLDIDLRWTILCDLFLVLIADSVYDARSRVLLERVGQMLDVSWIDICKFEKRVTDALEMQEAAEQNWSEEEHMENRRKQARNRRYMMMGLATIGGSLVIGLSGGLLAPVIGAGLAAGFTTIGVAGTSGFLAGAGGTALIASGAVVSGGTIAARASFNRTKSVKTFEYRPLHNAKRVNLIITISGWMNGKEDDVRLPYSTVDPIMGDIFSVLWEPEMLKSMGQTINILATEVLTQSLQQVLGSTVLVALMASLQLPVVLTKLSYLLDNPWSVSLDRATAAGLILADSLIHRNLGVRPVTLVGYSLGARVIYSCLQELAKVHAYGLVQNVYLFGSPVVARQDDYNRVASVVAGRFVNGYARNDWILGYLFRATGGGIGRVAGLAPVEGVPSLENVDVTDLVDGHMAYRAAVPKLLRRVGWIVLEDEFTEIEDPDPENHQLRQRELINELDEARKELEKEPKKRKFGFFGRNKDVAKKKDWETYEETAAKKTSDTAGDEPAEGDRQSKDENDNVLFDIDAIRAELAKENPDFEVKELPSTLPPLKTSSSTANLPFSSSDRLRAPSDAGLRHTKSYENAPYCAPGTNYASLSSPPQQQSLSSSKTTAYNYNSWHAYGSESEDEFGNPKHKGSDKDDEIQMTFDDDYEPASTSGRSAGVYQRQTNNPWADYGHEEEDEFGGEQEMTMTFA